MVGGKDNTLLAYYILGATAASTARLINSRMLVQTLERKVKLPTNTLHCSCWICSSGWATKDLKEECIGMVSHARDSEDTDRRSL